MQWLLKYKWCTTFLNKTHKNSQDLQTGVCLKLQMSGPSWYGCSPVREDIRPVHMRTNHVPKDVSERDSALSWFESLILALVNAKLFQIRLLIRVLKREKRAFWIVIRVGTLILGHVHTKLFRNVIRLCALKRADCAVGAKYYLAVRRSWL